MVIVSQSKPMALPISVPHDYEPPPGRFSTEGIPIIDQYMSEESAKSQKEKFPDMAFEGAGNSGMAVRLSNGWVGKYTVDSTEVAAANFVKNTQPQCVVRVHDIHEIEPGRLWMIILDRVQKMSDEETQVINNTRILSKFQSGYKYSFTLFIADAKRALKYYINEDDDIDYDMLNDLYSASLDWANCLQQHNLRYYDDDGSNVGWNNFNQLVVLDLGGLHKIGE